VLVIADEVYHRTVFDGDHAPSFLTLAEPDDPLVVVNGFSKAWAMTGWRIGWVVTPLRHEIHWTALSECFNTTTNVFSQLGAAAALEQGEAFVAEQQSQFKRGRDLVDAALGNHPLIDHVSPEGAFYAFPRIRGCTDSLAFAEGVLAEEDVGVAPGYTFGPGNDAHFRICFAQSPERLEEGLARIVRYIERHYG
jgi:aspartate/methionine/tyrosine aminotransferase